MGHRSDQSFAQDVEELFQRKIMKPERKAAWGALVISALVAAAAEAEPVMRIDDGNGTVFTIFDNSALDQNPVPGTITWLGNGGLAATGVSTRMLGGLNGPAFDLSCTFASVLPGPVAIWFSDNSFDVAGGEFRLTAGGMGPAPSGSTATFNAFVDPANTPLGTGIAAGTLGGFGAGAFAGEFSGSTGPLLVPYSASINAILAGPGEFAFLSTFNDFRERVEVPDSGRTVVWLLLSLGLCLGIRRSPGAC
jgi:hypothetical protein